MQQFTKNLNASPWKGCISEVGIGLEFSSKYINEPGASNTISSIECPYKDISIPTDMRAVSLENAKRVAVNNLHKARNINSGNSIFGLSITGAHYEDKQSHAWVCLATSKWQAYMHFSIERLPTREFVGRVVADRIRWFMNACLLSNKSWVDHINEISDNLEINNIDVLYAPGISDVERMLLLKPKNPLVYHKGKFQRVIDYLRKYKIIYPGSFNPPTNKHLDVGNNIYEISQQHFHKESISIEDMLHRVRMLDLDNRPCLLTQAPRFIDKREILTSLGIKDIKFLVGADTWNMTIDAHQYPNPNWLSDHLPNTTFLVMKRKDVTIWDNSVSDNLEWNQLNNIESDISSTDVRNSDDPGESSYITREIGEYIKSQKLYL